MIPAFTFVPGGTGRPKNHDAGFVRSDRGLMATIPFRALTKSPSILATLLSLGFVSTASALFVTGAPTYVLPGGDSHCTAVPDPGFTVQAWGGACASFGNNDDSPTHW